MSKIIKSNNQLILSFDEEIKNNNTFRPIHYLGSKLRILDFINKTIDQIDPNKGRVIDLFAGSGSVSFKLSRSRNVTSVDIQEYSRVICSALLKHVVDFKKADDFVLECKNSQYFHNLLEAVDPLIQYEKRSIFESFSGDSNNLCNLLENGSIISCEVNNIQNSKVELDLLISKVSKNLKNSVNINSGEALAVRYFGGLYFSYYQAAQIDSILFEIEKLPTEYRDLYQAALLSTVSEAVNTVGKQFAQPMRPRLPNGQPKPNLGNSVNRDRIIDLFSEYGKWLERYKSIVSTNYDHQSFRMDYNDMLDHLPNDTAVIYADPPYTRDHYSRFYHVLETLCLKDNPTLSNILSNGHSQISRGIYRENRHQSPFCIKKQAIPAFENIFHKSKISGSSLVLSYSPYDESKKVHPRVVTMSQLIELAKKHYKHIEVISPGVFTHSKLNHSNKNLEASQQGEVLIICQQ
jgi:adenine-specific DNA methylase